MISVAQDGWWKNVVASGITGGVAGATGALGSVAATSISKTRLSKDIEGMKSEKESVSYNTEGFDKLLTMDKVEMFKHEIGVTPYERLKSIEIKNMSAWASSPYFNRKDYYSVKFNAGLLAGIEMMIPIDTLNAFKELISKTPVSSKLVAGV